jgi:pimeloyl-ACP methyl ester carboxylesterase
LLERAGHRALAIDLPADDPRAGLRAYAKLVLAAIGKRRGVTLVAQSLGGFTAAVVAARAPKGVVERIVFVNAMIPVPGETAGDFWGDTGSEKARRAAAKRGGYDPEFDPFTYFLHDLPRRVVRELADHEREEAEISLSEPATFEKWPDVPLHVVVGEDDRFFPRAFQARIARERLGIKVDTIPGGHLVALSRPRELARRLLGYVAPAAR